MRAQPSGEARVPNLLQGKDEAGRAMGLLRDVVFAVLQGLYQID